MEDEDGVEGAEFGADDAEVEADDDLQERYVSALLRRVMLEGREDHQCGGKDGRRTEWTMTPNSRIRKAANCWR